MIHRVTIDDDDNPAMEFDDDGIEYMIDGLRELLNSEPGEVISTPSLWTTSPPWWRFWNRKGTPVIGEFRLRKVA